jgi:chemotaxis protein methyltransferase CheR
VIDLPSIGETADDGFRALAEKITRETEFRCTSYKDRCVRRRIAVRMRARGTMTYEQYADLLDSDSGEYAQLLDALTVNVTRFFRDPSTYAAIATHVIPDLWKRDTAVDVWSAGSASGEEAYSLAALFYEHARSLGQVAQTARVSVLGSDIDRASLEAADRALYLPASFTDTRSDLLNRLFPVLGDARSVIPALRALTRFERRDLLRDPTPRQAFDLVACRNVIIYLDRESQEALLEALFEALRPGGYLVLGHVETLFGRPRRQLVAVDLPQRIYRKPA